MSVTTTSGRSRSTTALEFRSVADHSDDIDRTVAHERAPHALPHQVVIVGDDHAQPPGHRRRLSPGRGNSAMTVVPARGEASIWRHRRRRRRGRGGLVKPVPRTAAASNPSPLSLTRTMRRSSFSRSSTSSRSARLCLRVLAERLGDREVRGALHSSGRRSARSEASATDGHGNGMSTRERLDRHQHSPVAEHRRMDALREVAKVCEHAGEDPSCDRLDVIPDRVGCARTLARCPASPMRAR